MEINHSKDQIFIIDHVGSSFINQSRCLQFHQWSGCRTSWWARRPELTSQWTATPRHIRAPSPTGCTTTSWCCLPRNTRSILTRIPIGINNINTTTESHKFHNVYRGIPEMPYFITQILYLSVVHHSVLWLLRFCKTKNCSYSHVKFPVKFAVGSGCVYYVGDLTTTIK